MKNAVFWDVVLCRSYVVPRSRFFSTLKMEAPQYRVDPIELHPPLYQFKKKWLVYSCCSHLEPRTSVKRFVSLQFINLRHSVGPLDEWSARRKAATYHKQNKHKQSFMLWVGFEPTISAFEWAKTDYALDRAATVIGSWYTRIPLKKGTFDWIGLYILNKEDTQFFWGNLLDICSLHGRSIDGEIIWKLAIRKWVVKIGD
jgi:hypothetical protein